MPLVVAAIVAACGGAGSSSTPSTSHTVTANSGKSPAVSGQPYRQALALATASVRAQLRQNPSVLRAMSAEVDATVRDCGGVLKAISGLSKSQANPTSLTVGLAGAMIDVMGKAYAATSAQRRRHQLAVERLPWSGALRTRVDELAREALSIDKLLRPVPACRYMREFAADPTRPLVGAGAVTRTLTRFQNYETNVASLNSEMETHWKAVAPAAYATFNRLHTELVSSFGKAADQQFVRLMRALGIPNTVANKMVGSGPTPL